jgi:hypothetical protein
MHALIVPRLLQSEWAAEVEPLSRFRETAYCRRLRRAYEELDLSVLYESSLHGPGHIERVLLFGALIAWQEALNAEDTALLLTACSYHDIGRINDDRDDGHGLRSARMLEGPRFSALRVSLPEQDFRILLAAVTAHSLPSKRMPEIGEARQVAAQQQARYLELAACLKDADNLDRVRLGDLDVSRLRHRSSRDLAFFAEILYGVYLQAARARA